MSPGANYQAWLEPATGAPRAFNVQRLALGLMFGFSNLLQIQSSLYTICFSQLNLVLDSFVSSGHQLTVHSGPVCRKKFESLAQLAPFYDV